MKRNIVIDFQLQLNENMQQEVVKLEMQPLMQEVKI